MTALALDPNSDDNLIFVTLEWLFSKRLGNKAKVHDLDRTDNLALIATSIMHAMVDVYHISGHYGTPCSIRGNHLILP